MRGLPPYVRLAAALMLVPAGAFADRIEEPAGATGSAPAVSAGLPVCLESHDSEITKWMTEHRKDRSKKYDAYKKVFADAGIKSEEIFARLVYAEAEGARCGAAAAELSDRVAGAIHNRIRNSGKSVEEIVFQYDQFASSLNGYSHASRAGFLCPRDAELWARVSATVKGLRSGTIKNVLPCEAVSYYFYKHNPKTAANPKGFSAPAWAAAGAPSVESAGVDPSCARFFTDERFKCGN